MSTISLEKAQLSHIPVKQIHLMNPDAPAIEDFQKYTFYHFKQSKTWISWLPCWIRWTQPWNLTSIELPLFLLCLKVSIQTLKAVGFSVWKYQSCMQECKEWEDQQIQARCMLETEGLFWKLPLHSWTFSPKWRKKAARRQPRLDWTGPQETSASLHSVSDKRCNFLPLTLSTLIQVQNKS